VDGDVEFARNTLALGESLDVLSPVVVTSTSELDEKPRPDLAQRIGDAFAAINRNKDVVLVEGSKSLDVGAKSGLSPKTVIELLGAKSLLVVRYRGDATLHDALQWVSATGQQPAGLIVNEVPEEQTAYVKQTLVSQLESNRLPILGIVPLDRALLGGRVADLTGYLSGAVVCCSDKLHASVDSVMIGARSFDSGLPYFNRKQNKILVSRAEKPDIQLAALATSTSCVVITGEADPSPTVIRRAMEAEIPVIRVTEDTAQTIDRIEQFFANVRFRQYDKVKLAERLIDANVDFDKLSSLFGLPLR
jgi:BioD-like phosphotransacetylase family protein